MKTIFDLEENEQDLLDEHWDSVIDRLEIKYGLHLDDWKRLGRDQMGQKCGRGWQGLRGACKRVPKGGDKDAAIKASKVALADKIRKKKGLRDRNAPKQTNHSNPQRPTNPMPTSKIASAILNKKSVGSQIVPMKDGKVWLHGIRAVKTGRELEKAGLVTLADRSEFNTRTGNKKDGSYRYGNYHAAVVTVL